MRITTFLAGIFTAAGFTAFLASAQETPPCTVVELVVATTPVEAVVEPEPIVVVAPPSILPQLRLNELLPNPVGDDSLEFIEVSNVSADTAFLAGWSIVDAAGKRFAFADGELAPESTRYLLYAESKLRLANTAGHLELIAPDGSVIDSVSYVSPVPEGKSYSRFDDGWRWASRPSPGQENEPDAVVTPTPTIVITPVAVEATAAPVPNVPTVTPPPVTVNVTFSSIQPNPDGSDDHEWFELRNNGSTVAILDGWRITDAGGGTFALVGTSIEAGAVRRFVKPAFPFALNNDTDTLRLFDPSGTERDRVTYDDAAAGATYERGSNGWLWSTDDADTSVPDIEPINEEQADTNTEAETPISALAVIDDGISVSIRGIVTLAPNVVGKTIFAIRDPEDEAGVYVRVYGRDALPSLAAGDAVRIDGSVRRNGFLQINTNAKSISLDGANAGLAHATRDVAELGADDDGLSVTMHGVVASRGKRTITMSDDAGASVIIARFMRGEAPTASGGDTVRLTGVVRAKGDALELIVTDAAAAIVTPAAKEGAEATGAAQETAELETTKGVPRLPITLAVPSSKPLTASAVAALVALAGGGFVLWKRNKGGQLEEEGLVDR